LGFLMGAMGIGAVAGTLSLARRTRTEGLPRVMAVGGFFIGCAYLAFAISPAYSLSLAIMPAMGLFVMRQMASGNTMIQPLIPDHYGGGIMALSSMTVVGLGPFGSLAPERWRAGSGRGPRWRSAASSRSPPPRCSHGRSVGGLLPLSSAGRCALLLA